MLSLERALFESTMPCTSRRPSMCSTTVVIWFLSDTRWMACIPSTCLPTLSAAHLLVKSKPKILSEPLLPSATRRRQSNHAADGECLEDQLGVNSPPTLARVS